MKRQNKKGFTIVELVIVIAVIAILAAVLIPTFSSVIKKAKISADTQVVRNMNTTLSVDEVVNGTPEDFNAVVKALKEDGYVISNLNPTTNGWFYVWESTTNQILLVDETYTVRYASEEGYPAIGNTWYFAISNNTVAQAVESDIAGTGAHIASTITSAADLEDAIEKGNGVIYIDENIVLNEKELVIDGGDATLNLNDASITGDRSICLHDSNVEINGGTIGTTGKGDEHTDADGKLVTNPLYIRGNSQALIKDTNIEISLANGFVYTHDTANSVFENVVIESIGDNAFCAYGDSITLLKNVQIKSQEACVFASAYKGAAGHTGNSVTTIEGGKYESVNGKCIWAYSATINVSSGEFTSESGSIFAVGLARAKIVVTGGTFNGVAFAELDTVAEWQALCEGNYKVVIDNGVVTITLA